MKIIPDAGFKESARCLRMLWIHDYYLLILPFDYINYFFFEKYTKMK